VVYSEIIVWSAPEQFVQDVPYQLVIVSLDKGGRLTGRIDDPVEFAEYRGGILYFRKVI
jgi:uncharacterized OB-fold protein